MAWRFQVSLKCSNQNLMIWMEPKGDTALYVIKGGNDFDGIKRGERFGRYFMILMVPNGGNDLDLIKMV